GDRPRVHRGVPSVRGPRRSHQVRRPGHQQHRRYRGRRRAHHRLRIGRGAPAGPAGPGGGTRRGGREGCHEQRESRVGDGPGRPPGKRGRRMTEGRGESGPPGRHDRDTTEGNGVKGVEGMEDTAVRFDVTEVSAAFTAAFGRQPDGVWAAPGRVNIIGEHTDYNDGFVLPMALPQGVRAAVGRTTDSRVRVVSRQEPGAPVTVGLDAKPGAVTDWSAYVIGVVWSLREAGYDVGGVDIAVDGDVPAGAGLSSSAALECAVAGALNDLFELRIEPTELARLAQRAENEFVGMPCGVMDQMASVSCTAGHLLFLDTRSMATEQVPFAPADRDRTLLVIDTRAPHKLVDGEYARRRRTCEE